jgi:hypothetical protein
VSNTNVVIAFRKLLESCVTVGEWETGNYGLEVGGCSLTLSSLVLAVFLTDALALWVCLSQMESGRSPCKWPSGWIYLGPSYGAILHHSTLETGVGNVWCASQS